MRRVDKQNIRNLLNASTSEAHRVIDRMRNRSVSSLRRSHNPAVPAHRTTGTNCTPVTDAEASSAAADLTVRQTQRFVPTTAAERVLTDA